jgi:hypothetical protein
MAEVRTYRADVHAHPSALPRSGREPTSPDELETLRQAIKSRVRVPEPTWLGTEQLSYSLDELVEVAIVAQDELAAIADNRVALRRAIAALLGTLRPQMAINEKVIQDFLGLDLGPKERTAMLARASRLVLEAKPAVDTDRLARALKRASEALTTAAAD